MQGSTGDLSPLQTRSSLGTASSSQTLHPETLSTAQISTPFISFVPSKSSTIQLGTLIHESLLGEVRKGSCRGHDGKEAFPVVVKVINMSLAVSKISKKGTQVCEDAFTELKVHQYITQKTIRNVIQLYGFGRGTTDHELHFYIEFAAKGDLLSFMVANNSRLPRAMARNFFIQLITGVRDLHAINVVHRDLSLENILLTETHEIKICDFGLATMCDPKAVITDGIAIGKVRYMAPELYYGEAYDPRLTDIWASGVILFIVLIGVFPYEFPTADDLRLVALCTGHVSDLLSLWKLAELDAQTLDLLSHIFCDPVRRWDADQILSHPFCTQVVLSTTNNDNNTSDKSTANSKDY